MKKTLKDHLDPDTGIKRILSLDGGGIRGALTLGYLKRIETIIRNKENNPNLLLCDYFDLIGGTSTGSIIAAGLAIGKTVDEIKDLYMELGGKIFGNKRHWWKPWEIYRYLKAEFDYLPLESSLQDIFKDIKIGSNEIKTGLCIVAKRADTNSTWPIINHPNGKFYNTEVGKNKNIPLWKAIRASSAAPTYFKPILIDVGNGEKAAFIDGGVSMANNPALTLLMVATLKGFPFHWEMNDKNLSIISIGTGYSNFQKNQKKITRSWLAKWAKDVPEMLMQDSSWQNQIIMQWLSDSPTAYNIDMEIGNLNDDRLGGKPQFQYLRYNTKIAEENLNKLDLNKVFTKKDIKSLIEMSNAKNREILYKIGFAASNDIDMAHF